ncbi:alpha/beta-type small acid-soluble spore protein [Irregularibacter muris]|uniref:Alpha/beta-type small acid-soluble spore protein n=1 Tax=Irregularibacter muris TaxID=1796619 RepID=A0AAE3L4A7_9FIRM|nr:alpha/beta-type small acid-soluble spore protein [Irregularibacter muris]MCR1899778.1 alpha/beta-type small acid-soluble spore protein [Irregularibacter muris]
MAKSKKKKKELTPNDILKLEIAEELGLMEKVKEVGWSGLTARETGMIGGIMTSRKKQKQKREEATTEEEK